MKRVWIAGGILVSVFVLTLCHSVYLAGFTEEIAGLLEQAEAGAGAGDWTAAGEYHRQARDRWEARGAYLHILLRHDGTDAVYLSFREAEERLQRRETGEYSAANVRIRVQLELLSEAERFTWKNIL